MITNNENLQAHNCCAQFRSVIWKKFTVILMILIGFYLAMLRKYQLLIISLNCEVDVFATVK